MVTVGNHMFVFCDKTIETTVTAKASVADDWVHNNIRRKHDRENTIVGFDCKFKHHPIKSMSNKIAILQLCVDTKSLILQLFYMDNNIPMSIRKLFLDQDITFVGVEINENVSKLWSEYGLKCDKNVDIRSLVKIWFPISYREKPSLKAMAYALAGLPMRKNKSRIQCDWESTSLDKELIEYASVDAYVCYKIAHRLLKEL